MPIAKRRLGQNFLVDARIADRIVRAVGPLHDEIVIEIGPGHGALTALLLENARRVIAIEFDRDLIALLRERFARFANLQLVRADALTVDLCSLVFSDKEPSRTPAAPVVANLPYNIATAILQRLIQQRRCIGEMVLMLQAEVAQRILAPPGSAERGLLSVVSEAYCEVEKLFDVAPRAFRPAPKVWSTVIRLRVRPRIAAEVKNEKLVWQLVKAGFAQRRKTILNNLRKGSSEIQELLKPRGGASIVLCEAGIDPRRRAETLTLAEWVAMANCLGS